MKKIQKWLTPLLLAGILSADPLSEPVVTEETLEDYLNSDFAQWKILHWTYVDSLESELDQLAVEISVMLEASPRVLQAFSESHNAFLLWAQAQANYSETVQWFDLATGEAYHGSGYGYTELKVLSTLYWERVLYYREILDSIFEYGFAEPVFPLLPDSSIGGF